MKDRFTAAQKFPHLPATVPAEPAPGPLVHRCAACNAPAAFGFGAKQREGRPGTWYCGPHKGLGG